MVDVFCFFLKIKVMAKQRYGINDGYRGTVGTVIGYLWRGQWCLRSRPRFVHNPNTPLQRAARELFSQASHLASQMKSAVRMGLNAVALERHRTAHNHFQSINRDCFSLREGHLEVDYECLVIAEGPVAPVGFGVPSLAELSVTVPFEVNPDQRPARGDDEVVLYVWCPSRGEGLLSAPSYRRMRKVTLTLPPQWVGLEVHLYGFAKDADGRASESMYIGCGTVPLADEMAPVGSGGEEGCSDEAEKHEEGGEGHVGDADAEGQPQQHGGGSREGQVGEQGGQGAAGGIDYQWDEQQGEEQRREQEEHPLEGIGIAVETCRQGGEEGAVEQIAQEEEEEENRGHKGKVDGCEALHGLVDELHGAMVLRGGFDTLGGDAERGFLLGAGLCGRGRGWCAG